jgi:predicted N-acetyltransferase YhbS
MSHLFPALTSERPQDGPAVDALIDRAFGPGRFVKAAERLREGRAPRHDLSFVAREGETVIGCVRLYDVVIGGTAALLLGPFAVDESSRGRGLGAALIRHACAVAEQAGHAVILLVGDEAFFAPLGFSATAARDIVMPGPVDTGRVLVLARPRSGDADGRLAGRVAVPRDSGAKG